MNNNRNNRRRGRGNRQQSGGNQMNRIDSRARGNAPQMLDKYKKLAQDAQHNDDRVQAEYYLQFADHYFRVIADNKARQDEVRVKRQDDREDNRGSSDDDDGQEDHRNQRRSRNRRDDRDDDEGQDHRQTRRLRGRADDDAQEGDESQSDNPFLREEQPARKPRKTATRKKAPDGEIDAAALPPSIGSAESEPAPVKKPVRRRTKPADEGESPIKAVG